MRKNYIPFAAGMATTALLLALVGGSLAVKDPPEEALAGDLTGEVAYGQVGLALFGEVCFPPGTTRAAEGIAVPTVLTYTDSRGGVHHYVEAETAAALFDVALGVQYHQELNCLDFGSEILVNADGKPRLDEDGKEKWFTAGADHDFELATVYNGDTAVVVDRNTPVTLPDQGIIIGGPSGESEAAQANLEARWARLKETPLAPEYGAAHGMFTEADPAEMDLGSFSGRSMDKETFQGTDIRHTFGFTPLLGAYAAITVENTGGEDVVVQVRRTYTVGRGSESFSSVRVPAGATLVRAFRLSGEADEVLQNKLAVQILPIGPQASVRLSAEQYRSARSAQ